jgi:D-erythro-7,8-dihydroneopterin triphosphate epimerase
MPDRITIKNLLVRGILGIKPEEREKLPDILINLELVADLAPAGESDAIDDAVNYRSVTKDVIALVEQSAYHTVEKLATEIARLAITRHQVAAITVQVEKPGALRFAESVGVVLTRTAADFAVDGRRG